MSDHQEDRGEMTMVAITLRAPRWLSRGVALGLASAFTLIATRADAQTGVGGSAFGALVNTAGVVQQTPVAVLPTGGGMDEQRLDAFGASGVVSSEWLTALTTGAVDDPVNSSQSSSELERVSVLGGVISADIVTAMASSYVDGAGAASDAAGSGFTNLVVNGVPVTTEVAPNTRVDLPGVGYAILNEQQLTGDGVTSSGITVNMIHVVLQSVTGGGGCTIVGCLPGVLTTTGEIIVGSARSAVGS
jgi:hypothetical protein